MPRAELESRFREAVRVHQAGQLDAAERAYREILLAHPDHDPSLTNLALLRLHGGAADEALSLFGRSLAVNGDQPPALANRGALLCRLGRHAEALADLDRAIALRPEDAATQNNRGFALNALGRHAEALESCDRALALRPNHAEALNNRGLALAGLGRHAEALASYERALTLHPDHVEALNNRGSALANLGRHAEALPSLDRVIALRPEYLEAHRNRAIALRTLRRWDEALASLERALALAPDDAGLHVLRGNVQCDVQQFRDACASYERAIALQPGLAEACSNLGVAMLASGDPLAALNSFDRALALRPDFAEALGNRGETLETLGRHEEALVDFNRAFALKPDIAGLRGFRLHERMHLCDWAGIEEDFESVCAALDRGELAIGPFPFLSVPSGPARQRRCAELFAARRFPVVSANPGAARAGGSGRIRVGYFSADYRDHVLANLIVDLIESHDRNGFEVHGFSYGPDTGDDMRRRLERAFDRFVDVRDRPDADVAALARQQELDIAVDLTGYTTHSRVGIFSHRPAPVQASYLGFPGTLGAPFMDYLIADAVVIPQDQFPHYAEKIVWLPPSFQVNGTGRPFRGGTLTRADAGLPESGFVFCCFCNSYKLTPDAFDIWMRLLREAEGSVLWLVETRATVARNLRMEAARRGVDAERLLFAPRSERAEYLARLHVADLFLDTFYYNAGVTASDALWAGLPVLTCPGEPFVARMAASLLTAIGLPELIAPSREAYEALALELASHPQKLETIRRKLAASRATAPLFDAGRFARKIEAAYRQMVERSRMGLAPDHIVIPP